MNDAGENQLLPAIGQCLSEQDRGLEIQMDIDFTDDDLSCGPMQDREKIDLFARRVIEQATGGLNAEGATIPSRWLKSALNQAEGWAKISFAKPLISRVAPDGSMITKASAKSAPA
jgi:hypothetical protein